MTSDSIPRPADARRVGVDKFSCLKVEGATRQGARDGNKGRNNCFSSDPAPT